MSQTDEFSVEIYDSNSDVPHKGNPITKLEVSPNEKYLITYSHEDNSIAIWDVENNDEGPLKLDKTLDLNDTIKGTNNFLQQMCVSDDKKLVYTYGYMDQVEQGVIYDMMNNNSEIKVDCEFKYCRYCTFNLKDELILYFDDIIYIYSVQTKNNKWNHKKAYRIPFYLMLISISLNDKVYFFFNNSIYEWDLNTEKVIKIFDNIKGMKYIEEWQLRKYIKKNIRISRDENNENLVCLRIEDRIHIYTTELRIHVASLHLNDATQLNMFIKHPVLCPLLFPLLFPLSDNISSSKFWEKCLSHLRQSDQLPKKLFQDNIQITNKYAFGILDGNIWKIDLEKIKSNMNTLYKNSDELNNSNSDEIIKNWYFDNETFETDDRLSIILSNPYSHMDIIHALFQEVLSDYEYKEELEVIQNLIRWRVINRGLTFEVQVFKKLDDSSEWSLISRITKEYQVKVKRLLGIKLINDSTIVILSRYCLRIYHLNENRKSISLIYFCFMDSDFDSKEEFLNNYKKQFSGPTLPYPNDDNYISDWVSSIKNNKEMILKYGVELLEYAIKEHELELVDDIYKKCIGYFKEENNNIAFLSIFTSTIHLLNEHYPEYISKYSSDTTMVMNSLIHPIDYNDSLHLDPFQIEAINSSLWSTIFSECKFTTVIIFTNPYIKFVTYPKDYNWFWELIKPQSNGFVETTKNKDIYKTWNGEALINFKWKKYGKFYYAIIWTGFMAFLGCFTVAATAPQQYIDDDVRNQLLFTSIILGFIHLSFEIRQIIYDPIKWIYDFWNFFDVMAFVLPIITSYLWLRTNEMNIIPLLSFSCLFLDMKFLLFFRAFEYFGVYFAIIISVARQIISFLVVLFIIIISFAHAFYILLSPRTDFSLKEYTSNNDPNNPWNVANTYQVFENGILNPNPYIIQTPNENTNMFIDFRTSVFAMYKFLTGDSSALSNWSYVDDPTLAILIVLFSLLIVVYLMNLLIGLLNSAIEKDNNKVSFLIQKAEILAEIELFYLLPNQRRWEKWFPEVFYYQASVDKTREEIKEMIKNNEWDTNDESKKYLLELLNIECNA
ncbi:hypothetical protein RclHR1_13150002 [Rhizophagus clarus]|uniref:Ion transport domain-containing protein n=1 Tax=Rhizophagus clarus TaxID=94130 RepID=A0A2Z6R1Y8_9GLOM|nr:hypothetical protein RclHR1_13150002 [Rhizophagus clarus]